jgi:hypothetical protein
MLIDPLQGWRTVNVTGQHISRNIAGRVRLLADEDYPKRAIRKPDLWYHDSDHAVLIRSNLVCHDVHFDPIQRIMRPI